jgi:soluble lytic murein transglycosylase-like protein
VYLTSLFPEPAFEPHGGYTLDKALVLGIARQESRLQAIAVSSAGARGVMQIMPDTAARITGDRSLAGRGRSRLDNPGYNMQLGQQYIRDLLDRSNGSLIGLCAAYNGGLGNLSKWLARHEGNDDPLMFIESIGAPETREYVKRVLTNIWMYRKRFNEPTDGIDQAAAGKWPIYSSWPGGQASAVH